MSWTGARRMLEVRQAASGRRVGSARWANLQAGLAARNVQRLRVGGGGNAGLAVGEDVEGGGEEGGGREDGNGVNIEHRTSNVEEKSRKRHGNA